VWRNAMSGGVMLAVPDAVRDEQFEQGS